MILKFHPTKEYAKDTGLIIVLALIIIAYWLNKPGLILPAAIVLVAAMTIPAIFMPAARLWHHFSFFLAQITNRLLLTLVFMSIVTPISLLRRAFGFDPMQRKGWKSGTDSVFTEKNHTFTASDLKAPF